MNMDMKRLAPVIRRHHGGFETATDGQLGWLFRSLDPAIQAEYLKEAEGPETPGAEAGDEAGRKECLEDAVPAEQE